MSISKTATDVQDHQRRFAPSMVERMTLILDVFERPQTRLTLEDVVQRTCLPRSTTHRILNQLVQMRWLTHSAQGYVLGSRALSLGGRDVGYSALRTAAAQCLHVLAMQTGMVVHLAVLEGTHICYLDKVGGPAAAAVPSGVGRRAPAECTAVGKAILASLPPEEIDLLYPYSPQRRTDRGVGSVVELHRELARIRGHQGLAMDRGEFFADVHCVGVAIQGPQGPVGAISVVGDGQTVFTPAARLICAAAKSIAVELFSKSVTTPGGAHRLARSGLC